VWNDLLRHYARVQLDAFMIMPGHVHGIIVLTDDVAADVGADAVGDGQRQGLPEVVRAFKTFSARRINELRRTPGVAVWRQNYYEHVVRDERALNAIRQYIADNPARWVWDRYNPQAAGPDAQAAELWRMVRE